MQRFLVRRFIVSILTLLAVSLIIFVMSRAVGDPTYLYLGNPEDVTQEDVEAMRGLLGLDKHPVHQYGIFLKNLATGNLGESIRERRPVSEVIMERLPATLMLGASSFAFALVIGIPMGIISAVWRGSIVDQIGKIIALIGQAAPPFWLGIMGIFFFAVQLGWLPPYGRQEPTGIILPTITLGWLFVAANMRLVRSAMLDVLDSEYIKLARAKGVSSRAIIWKHALRNSLIPPLTFAGVTMGSLVTGSLIAETVFAWPGLGQLAVRAMNGLDFGLLQGIVIIFTLMYVIASFLVDILYAYVDPRIRFG